ncbi:hypothetical protein Fmac_028961 [Flemingia macrophylla]|uniref:Uncharacterized protein n=1 Tax=Flemingia macrophylla TaxID=520843 RepID=A0ABD1L8Z4_9FABA
MLLKFHVADFWRMQSFWLQMQGRLLARGSREWIGTIVHVSYAMFLLCFIGCWSVFYVSQFDQYCW